MNFSVVIPSRNAANLDRCVDSIRARGESCRVLVVDDGLERRRGDCEYIEGVKPFVFSRNSNLGIRHEARDVFLMNDDAELKTAMGFTAMHERCRKYKGVVSCAIVRNVGNHQQCPRAAETGLRTIQPYGLQAAPFIAFVAVLIPWRVFLAVQEAGGVGSIQVGLDERFDAYGWDDTDYCMRLHRAGFGIGVFDGCHVDHADGSTFRTRPTVRNDYEAGKRQFEAKWPGVRV